MKTFAPGALAALAADRVAMVQLVLLNFPGQPIALNSSNIDLVVAGVTYKAAYGLGSVSTIEDKTGGELQGIQLELAAGSSTMIALALDEADEVQGTPALVGTAILDVDTLAVLDVGIDWAGRLDTMPIAEDGDMAAIRATAESKAVDLLRGTPSVYSDGDQQALYPGDRAFEFVVDQADKSIVWPAREYFFK